MLPYIRNSMKNFHIYILNNFLKLFQLLVFDFLIKYKIRINSLKNIWKNICKLWLRNIYINYIFLKIQLFFHLIKLIFESLFIEFLSHKYNFFYSINNMTNHTMWILSYCCFCIFSLSKTFIFSHWHENIYLNLIF